MPKSPGIGGRAIDGAEAAELEPVLIEAVYRHDGTIRSLDVAPRTALCCSDYVVDGHSSTTKMSQFDTPIMSFSVCLHPYLAGK